MMLTSQSHALVLTLSAGGAVNWATEWVEIDQRDGIGYAPGSDAGQASAAGNLTIVRAPLAAGITRKVKAVTLSNADTDTITVTLSKQLGAVTVPIAGPYPLAAAERLELTEAGLTLHNASGEIKYTGGGGGGGGGSTSLAAQADQTFLANFSGATAVPVATGATAAKAGLGLTNAFVSTKVTADTDGNARIAYTDAPATPSADTLTAFVARNARRTLSTVDQDGQRGGLEVSSATTQRYAWNASPGNTSFVAVGGLGWSNAGTVSLTTPATTSRVTRAARLKYSTAAPAGSTAYGLSSTSYYFCSTGDGANGGFYFFARYANGDTTSGARHFIGLRNSLSGPGNVDFAAQINQIGFGRIASSNNLQVYCAGGTAQTPIDLGASFPINANLGEIYSCELWCSPLTPTKVRYHVWAEIANLHSYGEIVGTAGTSIPANTNMLSPSLHLNNNATAVAASIDVNRIILEVY